VTDTVSQLTLVFSSNMYRKICFLVLILTLIGLLVMFLKPSTAISENALPEAILATTTVATTTVETPEVKPEVKAPKTALPYKIPDNLDPKTRQILTDLIHCESRGNSNALNPIDKDGTASHGLLQFKPSTFISAIKIVDPTFDASTVMEALYDPNLQIKAFLAYYGDGKPISWWSRQFPACSKQYGYWLDFDTVQTASSVEQKQEVKVEIKVDVPALIGDVPTLLHI
jgi:hypothetical protein